MVAKAARQDQDFLKDLDALQEKHTEVAEALLGKGQELNKFVALLLADIEDLKAMLHAISIGIIPPCLLLKVGCLHSNSTLLNLFPSPWPRRSGAACRSCTNQS